MRPFSPEESELITLKAIEQAMQVAGIAKIEPDPLLPVAVDCWPFRLSQDDLTFLKIQRISPA